MAMWIGGFVTAAGFALYVISSISITKRDIEVKVDFEERISAIESKLEMRKHSEEATK